MKPQSKCQVSNIWKLIFIAVFGLIIYFIDGYFNGDDRERNRLLKHFESINMAS
jgi:hypothetical protein